MSERATEILEEALRLPATERAVMVERLISSLDRPNPEIDELWAQEAERRIAAHDAGKMPATPAEEVFAELEAL